MPLFSLMIRNTFVTIISLTSGYSFNALNSFIFCMIFVPFELWGFFLCVLIRIRVISVSKRKKMSLGRGENEKAAADTEAQGTPRGVLDS